MTPSLRDEAGGATVAACFALAALVALTGVFLHLGGAVAARHRAQAAADLAALAAAHTISSGDASACAVAESLAQRMDVEVSQCVVDGWDVVVSTAVAAGPAAFALPPARAVARAGPAE